MNNIKFYLKYFIKRVILKVQLLLVSVLPEKRKKIKKYPRTIQLPITYKCNFDCVMCGMRDLIHNKDFTYEDLDFILSDKLFKNVVSVGLNGGEPFLKSDLVDCVKVMVKRLKKLRNIDIISNGFFTKNILEKLEQIKLICKENNVRVNVSFSVDGVGEMQDFMRNTNNSWKKINETIDNIQLDLNKYCDYLGVVCTVTKYNVYNLEEVEYWSSKKNIKVAYNIATVNARINNYNKLSDFTIFNDDKARMIAQEFFYKKFIMEKSERYYGIYTFINKQERIAVCPCQNNSWVTLTPNSKISYCATHSKELDSALDKSAYDIFNGHIDYLNELTEKYCATCSHYIYTLSKEGRKKYYKELLRKQKILF